LVVKGYPLYKDIGVEWLGDVPEHWEVKHLKSLAEIKGGKDSKEVELEEEDYPIYSSGGIFGRASKYLHKKPSVLLGRKGTIDKPLFVTEPFWSVDTMFYTEIKKQYLSQVFLLSVPNNSIWFISVWLCCTKHGSKCFKTNFICNSSNLRTKYDRNLPRHQNRPNCPNHPNHQHPNRKTQRTPQNPN